MTNDPGLGSRLHIAVFGDNISHDSKMWRFFLLTNTLILKARDGGKRRSQAGLGRDEEVNVR
jgi:hypothetical protein